MATSLESSATALTSTTVSSTLETDKRLAFVRRHYEDKGYRVHSGLQFGCEFVLYADDPSRVHSDFCVHVVNEDGILDWRRIQILVRSMPSLHKTLILAYIRNKSTISASGAEQSDDDEGPIDYDTYTVEELAIGTEHAPFRHKKQAFIQEPGEQQKKRKLDGSIVDAGNMADEHVDETATQVDGQAR